MNTEMLYELYEITEKNDAHGAGPVGPAWAAGSTWADSPDSKVYRPYHIILSNSTKLLFPRNPRCPELSRR
jgi:hypothetical protein